MGKPMFDFEEPSHLKPAGPPANGNGAAEPEPPAKAEPEREPEQPEIIEPGESLRPDELPTIEKPVGNLAKKLAAVLTAIQRIPKRGWNDHFKFKYATEMDISDAVRHLLGEAGVFIFPAIIGVERLGDDGIEVSMTFEFVDGETGESKIVPWRAEAQDKHDKGISKAVTAAVKYFLMKAFLIATGDEPENDGAKKARGYAGTRASVPATSSAAEDDAKDRESLKVEIMALLKQQLGIIGKLSEADRPRLVNGFNAVTQGRFDDTSRMSTVELRKLRDDLKSGALKAA